MQTITLPDGYNGHTVTLNAEPVRRERGMVMLTVQGREWLIKWVALDVYQRELAKQCANL
jgi:hypothetical protein